MVRDDATVSRINSSHWSCSVVKGFPRIRSCSSSQAAKRRCTVSWYGSSTAVSFFCLRVPGGSEQCILADLVYGLLVALLCLHQGFAQVGIIIARYRFHYEPFCYCFHGLVFGIEILLSRVSFCCFKLHVGIEHIYQLPCQVVNAIAARRRFNFFFLCRCYSFGQS